MSPATPPPGSRLPKGPVPPTGPFDASGVRSRGTVPGVAEGAAFFDLDRTLLRGASGPLITETLVAAGLLADRRVPGERWLYRAYDTFGETLAGMALARSAVLA